MRYSYIKTISLFTFISALAGCGGSSTSDGASNQGGGASGSDGVSFLSLSVLEAKAEFSFFGTESYIISLEYPYILQYLINPINSANLAPISNAVVSDYGVTVDELDIDSSESFPILQKVIGSDVSLTTALVFDLSASLDTVNMQALVNEAKSYIAAAQASSNAIIRNQRFVVWAFAVDTEELTTGFTSNPATLNSALDTVVTRFNSKALGFSSNLHRAVVETIGRFNDGTYNFADSADINDYIPINNLIPENDLVDYASPDGIALSQMVIFSSGPDTYLEMEQELMTDAIQSQAFTKYTSPSSSEARQLYKTVFYYVTGGTSAGNTYAALSDISTSTTSLMLSGGSYSFSSSLIQRQIAAISDRINLNNQYVYRFAFQPRVGDHTVEFNSESSAFSYTITSDVDGLLPGIGTPEQEAILDPVNFPLTEITGPNGEYISLGDIDFSEAQTFAAATRWTNGIYGLGDYSWSLAGGTGTNNANGTYTVNSIAGASATLTLNNTLRGESVSIVINN